MKHAKKIRAWLPVLFTATFGVLIFIILIFSHATPALAQLEYLEQGAEAGGLPTTSPIVIIARFIRLFLGVLGIIFVILVLRAGFIWMTSKGEAAKIETAKKSLQHAVIGLVIIFSSYAIVSLVLNFLFGGGSQITVKPPIEKYSEPLAGALGAGIIESHYPPRNAIDIPRNTKIFITFKEAIDEKTIMNNASELNNTNIWIFETNKGKDKKLLPKQVKVFVNEQKTIFVFDPVDLLGNDLKDTNYTVALQPGIKKADGSNAFTGVYDSGYGWTFEVSTEVDLTPPHVVYKIPTSNTEQPRNITVELTFSEAMDPVSSTGSYIQGKTPRFENISIRTDENVIVQGTYEISNAYRTVGFTSIDACAKDPCGDLIYCLPGSSTQSVVAKAASVDAANPPQAELTGVFYDGLTDAAGNSLDGNDDKVACGSETDSVVCPDKAANDHYQWSFKTNEAINDTRPKVVALNPDINAQNIDQNKPVEIGFNTLIKSSTVNSSSVSLWPDKLYTMWFTATKDDDLISETSKVFLNHPAFISNAEGGYTYYPVITHKLKSAFQICMYPAMEVGGLCNGTDSQKPYCCNGEPREKKCETEIEKKPLPYNE